jgi:hypothetical protein
MRQKNEIAGTVVTDIISGKNLGRRDNHTGTPFLKSTKKSKRFVGRDVEKSTSTSMIGKTILVVIDH